MPANLNQHPKQDLNSAIFREYDIRGVYNETLSEAVAFSIGHAFGSRVILACGKASPTVCTAYDGRLSSPPLHQALCEGLTASGCNVIFIGLMPTPALYFSVFHEQADGGIMVTGSHNPPDHNGFKMMLGKKPFFGTDIQALREQIEQGHASSGSGTITKKQMADTYINALSAAYTGNSNLHIGWDAGNGAAGAVLPQLTQQLPGTHHLLYAEVDGRFPNHHPDPSIAHNLEDLQRLVKEKKLDAGIAFDGDADRIGVVDDEGEILWGDQLLTFLATDLLKTQKGATIIADIKSSQLVFDAIQQHGGKPLMWKTGHSNIKSKMMETGAKLAGEMSGHIFYADQYYGFDDALYAAVRFLNALCSSGRKLSEWRKSLPVYANTPEIRIDCDDIKKFHVIDEIAAKLRAEAADFTTIDGVRVNRPEGWWLIRASNTQPIIVARAEAKTPEGIGKLQQEMQGYLKLAQSL